MFQSKKGHSFEVDFWAVGIILYYMLYGNYPFESKTDNVEEIYDLIKNKEPFYDDEMVSKDANDFIKSVNSIFTNLLYKGIIKVRRSCYRVLYFDHKNSTFRDGHTHISLFRDISPGNLIAR